MVHADLRIEAGAYDPDECVFKWRAIAAAIGFPERSLRRYLAVLRITLPKWGFCGRTGVVYLPRAKVRILRAAILRSLNRLPAE